MTEKTAEKFIAALKKLESDRDLETIVSLHSEDCKIGNVVTDKSSDAGEFWETYRKSFDKVSSSFKNKIFAEGHAALEWTTKGTTSDGHDFEYQGVSILEIKNEKITRFFAYFDPAELGRQMS